MLPLTPRELAADAAACVTAGADAFHVHPRDADGHETLDPHAVDMAVTAIRRATGQPVGVSTSQAIERDPARRSPDLGVERAGLRSVIVSEGRCRRHHGSALGSRDRIEGGLVGRRRRGARRDGFADRITRVLVEPWGGRPRRHAPDDRGDPRRARRARHHRPAAAAQRRRRGLAGARRRARPRPRDSHGVRGHPPPAPRHCSGSNATSCTRPRSARPLAARAPGLSRRRRALAPARRCARRPGRCSCRSCRRGRHPRRRPSGEACRGAIALVTLLLLGEDLLHVGAELLGAALGRSSGSASRKILSSASGATTVPMSHALSDPSRPRSSARAGGDEPGAHLRLGGDLRGERAHLGRTDQQRHVLAREVHGSLGVEVDLHITRRQARSEASAAQRYIAPVSR